MTKLWLLTLVVCGLILLTVLAISAFDYRIDRLEAQATSTAKEK